MRVIRELFIKESKITIFSWNNRYLIKLEQGFMEQTFKIDQFEIQNEDELLRLIDAEFVQQASQRFLEMGQSLHEAKIRADL
jgi:hypothetical protein